MKRTAVYGPQPRPICKRERAAMPLSQFPPEKRAAIEAAVAQPEPPPKFIYFGAPDSPRPLAWMESRAWFEWHWRRGKNPGASVPRQPIPPGVRAAVVARDGFTCGLCGEPVDPTNFHLDHIVPWSRGGGHNVENLQVAHPRCNSAKGARVG